MRDFFGGIFVTKKPPKPTTFGTKLRGLREALGMTQTAMANAVKVHRVQISKYERDVAEPSWSVIQRLATVLGVTPNDFLADGEK